MNRLRKWIAMRALKDQHDQWMRGIADTTRFIAPDGSICRMARMDVSELGRIVELEVDPHGAGCLEYLRGGRRWWR